MFHGMALYGVGAEWCWFYRCCSSAAKVAYMPHNQ